MMTLLEAIDLDVGYASRRQRKAVLAGVSVTVEAGELIAVLGPNGAGKSTLLRTLAGMQPPLGGRLELLGRPLDELRPRELARRVGVVLPERVTPGLLTAAGLVGLGRYPYTDWLGRLRRADHEKVQWALSAAGASHLAARDVSTLSDGERQKVMIARAWAQEPTVMILDEPTAFLDLPGRVEIMALLSRLARDRERQRTVLLSTHDLDLALRSADRVWLLDGHGGLSCGVPEDLVLSGALGAAFERGPVRFDAWTGSFHSSSRPTAAVALRGRGVARFWTQRALERRGYRVGNDRGAGNDPVVEVGDEEGRIAWRSTVGGETRKHATIEDLLARLPRLRPPPGDDNFGG